MVLEGEYWRVDMWDEQRSDRVPTSEHDSDWVTQDFSFTKTNIKKYERGGAFVVLAFYRVFEISSLLQNFKSVIIQEIGKFLIVYACCYLWVNIRRLTNNTTSHSVRFYSRSNYCNKDSSYPYMQDLSIYFSDHSMIRIMEENCNIRT